MRNDPLADLLGPGLARHLAEVERLDKLHPELTGPLTDPALARVTDGFRAAVEQAQSSLSATSLMKEIANVQRHQSLARETMAKASEQLGPSQSFRALADSVDFSPAKAAYAALEQFDPGHPTMAELHKRCRLAAEKVPKMASGTFAGLFETLEATQRLMASATNPPSLATELAAQLNRSSLWEAVGNIDKAETWLSASLEESLTQAVSQQPTWRELMKRLESDDRTSAPDHSVTLQALKEDFVSVSRQVLPEAQRSSEPQKLSSIESWMLLVMILSLLFQAYQNHANGKQMDRLETAIKSISNNGRWVIQTGHGAALRSTPRKNGRIVAQPGLGTILTEEQRNGNWIEVEARSCDDRSVTGWIHVADLDRLSSTDSDYCPEPVEDPPTENTPIPKLMVDAGPAAIEAWQDFFLAQLVNRHTRSAYQRACSRLFEWCEDKRVELSAIRPAHVAQWRDELIETVSPATVKQQLSAVKRLFDWLQLRQVINSNAAQPVRPPRLSRRQARSPALQPSEVIRLFDTIDGQNLADQRDRAALAIMIFSLARVSAVANLTVKDISLDGPEASIRLMEKRGQELVLPLNAAVAAWVGEYMAKAGITEQSNSPLFRSLGRGGGQGEVTERGMSRQDLHAMTRRRFTRAGISCTRICHALRATGITMLLMNHVPIEIVARLAGHASIATTQQYDRRDSRDLRQALTRLSGAPLIPNQ